MEFSVFGNAVKEQFNKMSKHPLFRVKVERQFVWDSYLDSFPAGSNPIYKERTEHDCQCCKSFVKAIGNVVAIIDNNVHSIWDISIGSDSEPYQVVANEMSKIVKSFPIDNIFVHTEQRVGNEKTYDMTSNNVQYWNHFNAILPRDVIMDGALIGPKTSEARSTVDVMYRGLTEIDLNSLDIVLELIANNLLYRGQEHEFAVNSFRKLKVAFNALTADQKPLFCWSSIKSVPESVSRFRSTVIGTLLQSLSEGMKLEDAVNSFESKVAPTNYKRPTALVTKAMIAKAAETVQALGFSTALERRYANLDDITINNILFADRKVKQTMNVFDSLSMTVPTNLPKLDRLEEVHIDKFLNDILPKASSVELLFENRHQSNLVSLIAPMHEDAKRMFKWDNNFSWSYTGEVTDSIKEKVKVAGGNVTGDFRASLSWFNYDDLDLHLVEPGGDAIYFGHKINPQTKGQLDVDMNASYNQSRSPVENIFFPNRQLMKEGQYKLFVNQFSSRETVDLGFDVEIEFNGVIHSYSYPNKIKSGDNVLVARFNYTHKAGMVITESLPSIKKSKKVWNIDSENFHKVNVIMYSPNHWDDKPVGNKHFFFMLDGCLNEGQARGFFNEFLIEELTPHRKVFEMVGAKMRTDESSNQLSGLGFSSTQRNSIVCRVNGSLTRLVKVLF